jgi:hypothetical protein
VVGKEIAVKKYVVRFSAEERAARGNELDWNTRQRSHRSLQNVADLLRGPFGELAAVSPPADAESALGGAFLACGFNDRLLRVRPSRANLRLGGAILNEKHRQVYAAIARRRRWLRQLLQEHSLASWDRMTYGAGKILTKFRHDAPMSNEQLARQIVQSP